MLELVFSTGISELRDETELLAASSVVEDKVGLIEMVASVLESNVELWVVDSVNRLSELVTVPVLLIVSSEL